MPRLPRVLLRSLLLALALLPGTAGPPARAEGPPALRVATILVQGLHRIERAQLLADLQLREGGAYSPGLERRLEQRGRRLGYLRSLQVDSRAGSLGMHLTLRVREARAFSIAPLVTVLDDGDLDGGLRLDGIAPLGRGESWQGQLLVGSLTEGRLRVSNIHLASFLPRLHLETGVSDYDDPFLDSQLTRWWNLAGPGLPLPRGGALVLLGGWERLDSEPARGRDPDGSEAHGLFRLELEQPLPGPELAFHLDAALRTPADERGYGKGHAALSARREQGRWTLEGLLAGGLASHGSPASELDFMDAWRWLKAYPIGSRPARQFQFARLRADFRVHHIPVRMRRGAPPEPVQVGPYLLLEGSRFREYRGDPIAAAGDWGLGLAASLPGRIALRASLGVQWNEDGEPKTLFLLEER